MFKKTSLILVFAILMVPLYPSIGMSRHYYSPRYHHHYQSYHGEDALLWGLGGLILGTVILSAVLQPPPTREVVYTRPPTPVYTYPPEVPPGMCRWERYVLDDYGRVVYDGYGRPVKQYTLGSCQYPPN